MTRPTIEQIVEFRDRAIELYSVAFDAIKNADDALSEATAVLRQAAPNGSAHYYGDDGQREQAEFFNAVKLPDRERYLRVARKIVDCSIWDHIVTVTDLERLMDSQAKKELREQMRYVPDRVDRAGQLITDEEAGRGLPPVTVGNIVATLEKFSGEADFIFRRGLANVFSKMDRRFRSHNGFRFGDRVILNYLFSGYSTHSVSDRYRDTLLDIERSFQIVCGDSPKANGGGIVWQISNERTEIYRSLSGLKWDEGFRSEHIGQYFTVRCFKNGNAHLWFTNKEALAKVNRVLGEWYGEVVGDGQTQEADPLNEAKQTPAKRYGFFPTPPDAGDRLFSKIPVNRDKDEERLRILEPSAGTGNLAFRCITKSKDMPDHWRDRYRYDNIVDCVEIQPELAGHLQATGAFNKVTCGDFMTMEPQPVYDIVVMNPPFDRERDIDHVVRAMRWLKPGGELHSIMSAGTEFRQTKKSEAFRALMEKLGARWEDLPVGSFSESGTNVNTIILRVKRPEGDNHA